MTSPPGPDQPGPAASYWPPQPPDHPEATSTLVIGLVSIIGTFICFLPAVLGPWAWIRGRRVIAAIDASGGQLGGRGVAQAGYVMGIIASILLGIGVLTVVVAVVIAFVIGAAGSATSGSTY